jgi:outer membrane protein TolC
MGLLLFFVLLPGCAAPSGVPAPEYAPPVLPPTQPSGEATIQRAGFHAHASPTSDKPPAAEPVPAPLAAVPAPIPLQPPGPNSDPPDLPFAGQSELSPDALVQGVLARNPSLAQMVAAWRAAAARYPQVTSLDDPMFGTTLSPSAIGQLEDGNRGYRLDISQKLPWCGKLALRGDNALAEARAAGNEVEDTKLQLIEAARSAYYDYFLVERDLAVNRESLRLLGEFREEAESRYKRGLGLRQDVLQADVEIGQQQERQVMLERQREVAVARINTLLHLPPDAPLPPPAQEVGLAGPLPDTPLLRQAAQARRPDLQALANRIAAEQASLALARKEFYPDFDVMGAYDTYWVEKQLRPQVAVRLNLPVRTQRRYAAVAEAQERLAGRQAELARLTDQVNLQVQEAAAQVRESERVVRLYQARILRSARENVEAAWSAYRVGRVTFLNLVEAQRNLVRLQDGYYEALAAYGRRRATLERVIGGPLGPAQGADSHP